MLPLRSHHLALVARFGVMATVVPTALPAQGARAAIEAQYERLAQAIRRHDIEGILAIQAPNYSSINPTGSRFDYAGMERYTRQMTAAVDSVIHIRNLIRTFEQHGDTAVADVCQEFSRLQRMGDGRLHRVDTSALQREAWISQDGSWKRLQVRDVRGTRWFVDGVRVDPSRPNTDGMPAYVPEADPPTGCGLH